MGHKFRETMANYLEQYRKEFTAESELAKRVLKANE